MSAFDRQSWERLKLVKSLLDKPEGAEAWYDISETAKHLAPILYWRPPGLEEFTDHDLDHSYRIVRAIGAILPDRSTLNRNELMILLYSAIFHDLGMWTPRTEVASALSDSTFVDHLSKQNPSAYAKIMELIDSFNRQDQYVGQLLLRTHVALWHRRLHPERSATALLASTAASGAIIPQRISDELIPAIALVCAAHGWTTQNVLTSDELDRHQVASTGEDEQDWVNLRFLALLLRIGDLLDLDNHRISTLVWTHLHELAPEAEAHWRKHSALRFKNLDSDLIQVVGEFNYERHGHIAAEAFNLAQKWMGYIAEEADSLKRICVSPEKYGLDHRACIGSLVVDASGIAAHGILFAEDLSFTMDKRRIVEILGEEIYEDKSAFIRELIQNALDATRTQIVKKVRSAAEFAGIREALDMRSPNSWPRDIVEKDEYAIHIRTGYEEIQRDGRRTFLLTFEIKDGGIGMTPAQIRKYFLQIGHSYYRSQEFTDRFKHGSISRFGIGFLSCLLVAVRIEVETRPHESADGVRLVIETGSDTIGAFEASGVRAGTRVKLWFPQEITESKEWITNKYHSDKIAAAIFPRGGSRDKLVDAVHYWAPWVELPLFINDMRAGSRTPHAIEPTTEYWSFPYAIRAIEDKELLAVGAIVRKRERSIVTVHHFHDNMREISFLPSVGGVSIPPWNLNDDFSVVADILRLPSGVMSASRRARFEIPAREVQSEVLTKWVYVIDEFYSNEAPYRSLFRCSIPWGDIDLPLLLPVVRTQTVKWEEWDERRFKHEPCVLVPFFAPLRMSLSHSLPIVGVPRRASSTPRKIIPQVERVQALRLHDEFTAATTAPTVKPEEPAL